MKTINKKAIALIAIVFSIYFASNLYSNVNYTNDNKDKCCDSKCIEAKCCTDGCKMDGSAQGNANCCSDKCESAACKKACSGGKCEIMKSNCDTKNMNEMKDMNNSETKTTDKADVDNVKKCCKK
ncbi:MAG: hypothetical protein LH629_15270 [Ignavibacteria bacterium]|nr:hypothetical protein [Ignavibacteria bacterium]